MSATITLRNDERVALSLMQAIRADAEHACAPDLVELVSAAFDVTQAASAEALLAYAPRIDRKTRTILFTGGAALSDGKPVMTATVIYRIRPAG